jgi:hypothetical protein
MNPSVGPHFRVRNSMILIVRLSDRSTLRRVQRFWRVACSSGFSRLHLMTVEVALVGPIDSLPLTLTTPGDGTLCDPIGILWAHAPNFSGNSVSDERYV